MQNLQSFVNNFGKKASNLDVCNELFFSMFSSAELYIINRNAKTTKISKSTTPLSKTKERINSLFLGKDEGIEKILNLSNDNPTDTKTIDLFNIDVNKNYVSQNISPLTKFLKNMYHEFVNYGKKAYGALENKGKKVDGFVKLTIHKILKLGEYIMALTSPQWNKVTGSPDDKDTYSMTLSQKESIDSKNAKYEIGYPFLRYRA